MIAASQTGRKAIDATLMLVAAAAVLMLWNGKGATAEWCFEPAPAFYPTCESQGVAPPGSETLTVSDDLTLGGDHSGSISIAADDVTLDCAGHEIRGSGPAGVDISGRANVTVRDCKVAGFTSGLHVSGATATTLDGNTAHGNLTGFQIEQSTGTRLQHNLANSNSHGFSILDSVRTTIEDNSTNRGYTGISLHRSDETTLRANRIKDAFDSAIELHDSDENVLTDNVVAMGEGVGIVIDGSGNELTGNEIDAGTGILLQGPSNLLEDNTITAVDLGIRLKRVTGSSFTGNVIAARFGFEFDGKSLANRFVGNSLAETRIGVVGPRSASENEFVENLGIDFPVPLLLTADHTLNADHEGPVVLDADGITLDCAGHSVAARNDGKTWEDRAWTGISVEGRHNTTIENCRTAGGGIVLRSSTGTTILNNNALVTLIDSDNNRIVDNTELLVRLTDSDDNQVSGNGRVMGISLQRSSRNVIENNDVVDDGISLKRAHNNTVTNNRVTDEAMTLMRSNGNTIEGNEVTVTIDLINADDNTVVGNTVSTRGLFLFESHANHLARNNVAGIALSGSHVNRIEDNTARADFEVGDPSQIPTKFRDNGAIALGDSNNNTVTGNAVLAAGISARKSRHNTFEANTMTGGSFLLRNGSNRNTVLENTVSGAEFGFRIVESHNNTFTENTAAGNEVGFRIARAHDNIFQANEVTGDGKSLVVTGNATKTYGNVFTANVGMQPS